MLGSDISAQAGHCCLVAKQSLDLNHAAAPEGYSLGHEHVSVYWVNYRIASNQLRLAGDL